MLNKRIKPISAFKVDDVVFESIDKAREFARKTDLLKIIREFTTTSMWSGISQDDIADILITNWEYLEELVARNTAKYK